jgi:hypothetical protein
MKRHKETPCINTLNKEKYLFFLLQNQRRGQNKFSLGGWYQWEEVVCGEKV